MSIDVTDPAGADPARRLRPEGYGRAEELLRRLDPHFADLWSAYQNGLLGRSTLDVRTRLLVLAGQHTMRGEQDSLADVVTAAHAEGLDLKEVLEAIVQCYVYGGARTVEHGIATFAEVAERLGVLDDVASRGLPSGATRTGRDLAAEQETWTDDDRADPRLEPLLERYGWYSVSNGLRLRPGQHINLISQLDAIDPDFCERWLDMCMEGLYGRFVLDDKTRLLCMVGDCLAVGDTYQYPRHMLGALRAGATVRELLEVVIQSVHVIGHPLIMGVAINDLIRVLDSVGRLDELADDPSKLDTIRTVAAARIAGRTTVTDMATADGVAGGGAR